MRRSLILCTVVVLLSACGDESHPAGGAGTGGVGGAGGAGAGGEGGAGGSTTPPPENPPCDPGVCTDSIAPSGYTALGPAVRLDAAPAGGKVTLPFAADPQKAQVVEVLVKRRKQAVFSAGVSNLDLRLSPTWKATFKWDEPGTFQLARKTNALEPKTRHYVYRAMAGVSMGGMGTGSLAFRHPDMFDAVGILGADPGVDARYTLDYLRNFALSGFCDAESGKLARPGTNCAAGTECFEKCETPKRPLYAGELEREEYFERLIYEEGSGTGLTLRRSLYVKALRDLAKAYGNGGFVNPAHAWLPPGVTDAWLANPARCTTPVVLRDFYHRRFNPDGSKPVITFCDGGDKGPTFGVYEPTAMQTDPVAPLLAVDYNANGKRDSGEGIVALEGEPYSDFGTDGVPSAMEPGYDAATNPDPAGDDFDYLRNPAGTEGNRRHDPGEPFEDTGIDGVLGKGCKAGTTPPAGVSGCYDWGEGDGQFTESPATIRIYEHSAPYLWEQMTPAVRDRLDVYTDAGIRDFFNGHVSTNRFFSSLVGAGRTMRFVEGFPSLTGGTRDQDYDFQAVDWRAMGRGVYIRYGNPDASPADIENGDGRHVGSALQILQRVQTMVAWMSARFPGGDYDIETLPNENFMRDQMFTTSSGRITPYAVFLPPGYTDAKNAAKRYPVIYFLHGYGQDPNDLIDLSALFGNYMVNPSIPEGKRFQKFIIVYIDGRCRPGGNHNEASFDPAAGDGCEQGTFYTDSVSGQAKMETAFLELAEHIDRSFRTKLPEDVQVSP